MRHLGVLALAAALAACGASTPSPPRTAEPSAARSAPPYAEPSPVPAKPSVPVVPVEIPTVSIQPPKVALVAQPFAIGALPPAATASAEELELAKTNLPYWATNFAEMLTRFQFLSEGDAQKQAQLKGTFESMIKPGPFADTVELWALDEPMATRKFETSDAALIHVYGKTWQRAAYADVRMKLGVKGGSKDSVRDLIVRVQVARGAWKVIDAFDFAGGRWLVGEKPQYSAPALESDVPAAVASYLWNESYTPGASTQFNQRDPSISRFWAARAEALKELNDRFASGKLVDRHFEGVTVRLIRFDPATYLGDGVLTVSVSGRLMERDGTGAVRQFPFTQQMKFLRSVKNGFVVLAVVDQQSTDGTWDSGGALALYANDAEFG
jgi:hypothetical protein